MSRLSDLHDDWFLNTKWYLTSVTLIVFLNLNGLLCIMNGLYKKNAYKQRFMTDKALKNHSNFLTNIIEGIQSAIEKTDC